MKNGRIQQQHHNNKRNRSKEEKNDDHSFVHHTHTHTHMRVMRSVKMQLQVKHNNNNKAHFNNSCLEWTTRRAGKVGMFARVRGEMMLENVEEEDGKGKKLSLMATSMLSSSSA